MTVRQSSKSAFHPLRTLAPRSIKQPMRSRRFLDRLAKRAPDIVILTLFAALLGAWTDAPAFVANGLAIVVGILALGVLATRRRRPLFENAYEQDSSERPGWLEHELAGKGTPHGSYLLAFFGFLTIMLTGFNSPFGKLAWAGLALTIAWSVADIHFPADQEAGD